jgi:orotidine-5'-phosphate decarboxylase
MKSDRVDDMRSKDPRVIVALDLPSAKEAQALARQLEPSLCRLKVGKELFVGSGPALVAELVERGFDVFLDLKFHDIPNTVYRACRTAADLGVWMIDVHVAGGPSMIAAAVEGISSSTHSPLLVGVTVLTSIDSAELTSLGMDGEPLDWVMRWARVASENGLDGVVCSAQEASHLRRDFADDLLLVTPGIRPKGAAVNDQRRTVSPSEALALGADYLVIGRPITNSTNPHGVLLSIQSEISYR